MSYHNNGFDQRGIGTETFRSEPNGYDGMGAVSLTRDTTRAAPLTSRLAPMTIPTSPRLVATPTTRIPAMVRRLQPGKAVYGSAPRILTAPAPKPAGITRVLQTPRMRQGLDFQRPSVQVAPPVPHIPISAQVATPLPALEFVPPVTPPRRGKPAGYQPGEPAPGYPGAQLPADEQFYLEEPEAVTAPDSKLPIKWIALAGGGALALYLLWRKR